MEQNQENFEQPDEELVDDNVEDESTLFKYSITSYGADYPIDGLVSRLASGAIFIPKFQRGYVWNLPQASRFIESLLLGLPVPGIFLSKESESNRMLVIDGQQRLKTLQFFYKGIFNNGKEFKLAGVQEQFENLTYEKLEPEIKIALNDYVIHATIIKQDEPSNDESSVYYIFERLNSGGVPLQPQEIRACIYHGDFNDLLEILSTNPDFRNIYGKPSARLKDRELILRFISFHYEFEGYKKPLKGFLNEFMGKNRNLKYYAGDQIKYLFDQTIKIFNDNIGSSAFRLGGRLNAALFDSVMVGLSRRLTYGQINSPELIKDAYDELLNDKTFFEYVQGRGSTSDEANVLGRIKKAISAFENLV